jgi:hypothetical protein
MADLLSVACAISRSARRPAARPEPDDLEQGRPASPDVGVASHMCAHCIDNTCDPHACLREFPGCITRRRATQLGVPVCQAVSGARRTRTLMVVPSRVREAMSGENPTGMHTHDREDFCA